jgi:hypothetical protein
VASGSSRPNYLAVAYAPIIAMGATVIDRAADRLRAAAARGSQLAGRWLRPATLVLLLAGGLPLVPAFLPLMPVERFAAYLGALHLGIKPQEHTREGALPQVFADMFGWEELTRRVARVYHSLPPAERAKCAIFAWNYGEAGAIDFFGPRLGLPPAISPHNNYWLWGTHGATGEIVIIVGGPRDDPHSDFRSAVLADTTSCRWCMPFENGRPIFLCKGLNQPLARRWQEIRGYR